MNVLKRLLPGLLGWLVPTLVWASHIVGGNLEMAYVGPTGTYTLSLHLFFDEINGMQNAVTRTITVGIFRKSDNYPMQYVVLDMQSRTAVKYTNEACAAARSLKTSDIYYERTLTLDPAQYNDPGGYYIVWERCCRNAAAENIVNPGRSGMTFYLEFPPLLKNGQNFIDSSPAFGIPNGEYICRNEPFQTNFNATDPDGDELRYSLVTPYMGYSAPGENNSLPRASSAYPPVNWVNGFSATTQIMGNPPLQINNRGVLSVTASTLGLHVFCVQVEEYRNGQRIGLVRRDFQLLVIDCDKTPLPQPPIYTEATPLDQRLTSVKTVRYCEGESVTLQTFSNLGYNYQWQFAGDNLPGSVANTLSVTQPGQYTVVISSKTGCSSPVHSEITTVIENPGPPAVITPDGATALCVGQPPVTLRTISGNYTYQWLRGSDTLRTEKSIQLTVSTSGEYRVRVKDNRTGCSRTATQAVTYNPLPDASLTKPSKWTICANESATFSATAGSGNQYEWRRDGVPIQTSGSASYTTQTAGIYSVKITTANQCTATSDTFRLQVNALTPVAFDSIPATCGNGKTPIILRATPTGGTFAGPGVTGDRFEPAKAGWGEFPITYTYVNSFGCTTTAQRLGVSSQNPRVQLGLDVSIEAGDSTRLRAESSTNVAYEWTPPDGLSSTTVLNPVASPTRTTTYALKVSYSNGCFSEDQITVTVWDKLTIPNAFTPNGDGANDSWELRGLELYPDAEVLVFNRWGSEVFRSKGYENPFDGTLQGQRLPVATYYYVIRPNRNGRPPLTGSVTILQ